MIDLKSWYLVLAFIDPAVYNQFFDHPVRDRIVSLPVLVVPPKGKVFCSSLDEQGLGHYSEGKGGIGKGRTPSQMEKA